MRLLGSLSFMIRMSFTQVLPAAFFLSPPPPILDNNLPVIDIKADNVFINWQNRNDEIIIDKVQLGDLEDAAHIPAGCDMIGKQAGNWMWRSPEAHARGPVNKPSDIFSFALVVSLIQVFSSTSTTGNWPSASALFTSALSLQSKKMSWKRASIPLPS